MLFLVLAIAATPLTEPVARTSSLSAAIASAHCATLRIDAHPNKRIALASRICLRPGDDAVVEERGIVDLDARRFTFVRAPFTQVDDGTTSWPPMCAALDDERGRDDVGVAHDAVSRVLRDARIAPCLLARATSSDHALWTWRGALLDPNQSAPDGHPVVSGRFVAVHDLTGDWQRDVLVVESTVFDTRSLRVMQDGDGVYVPRFRGETAETLVMSGGVVQSWLVDYAKSPANLAKRGIDLSWSEAAGLWGYCGDDDDSPIVEAVDETTFRGFFDEEACRRHARSP